MITDLGSAERPTLLIFDLDGTLIDSSLDLCLSVNAALQNAGAPELPHPTISSFIGDGAATLVRRALAEALPQQSAEVIESRFEQTFRFFLAFYRQHKLDHTRLYDGVFPALQEIEQAWPGVSMAVLTNKPVRPAVEICNGLGIEHFFFRIYGGDSFPVKKPDPVGLHRLADEAMGRQARPFLNDPVHFQRRAILIGDSPVDVRTAKAGGVRSLGCRYGLDPEALQRAGPDLVCDHPREWLALLTCS